MAENGGPAQPGAGPLHVYTVVELSTGIAGAYCTKLLADGGAQVIKVESPQGDPLRSWSASGRASNPPATAPCSVSWRAPSILSSAVINYTKTAAFELAPHGIRVNATAPDLTLAEGL